MDINQIQNFNQIQLIDLLKEQDIKIQIQNNIFSENNNEEKIKQLSLILYDYDFYSKIYLLYDSLQKYILVQVQRESQICQNYDKFPQEKIIQFILDYIQNQQYKVTTSNLLQIKILNFVQMTRKYIFKYLFLQQIIEDSFSFLENKQLNFLGIETLANNCQAYLSIFEDQLIFEKYKQYIIFFTKDFRKYRHLLKLKQKFKDFTQIQLKKFLRQIFCSKIILKKQIDTNSYTIQEFLQNKKIFINCGDEYLIKIMSLFIKFEKNHSRKVWRMLINIYESQDICDLIITDVDFLQFFIDLISNINLKEITKKDNQILNEVQQNLQNEQSGFKQEVIQRIFQRFKYQNN